MLTLNTAGCNNTLRVLFSALNDAISRNRIGKVYVNGSLVLQNQVLSGKQSLGYILSMGALEELQIVSNMDVEYTSIMVEYANNCSEVFDDLDSPASRSADISKVDINCSNSEDQLKRLMSSSKPVRSVRLIVDPTSVNISTGSWLSSGPHSKEEYFIKTDSSIAAHNLNTSVTKDTQMKEQNFMQSAATNLTATSKSVVSDALDVATGMAAVEAIKQIAFSVMPIKVGFMGRLMGANSWVKDNAFVTLGIVTVVHTILKSSNGRLTVNDTVMEVADNALRYATFKAVESLPINKLIQDLSDKLTKISGK